MRSAITSTFAALFFLASLGAAGFAFPTAARASEGPHVLDTQTTPVQVRPGDWVLIPGEGLGSKRGRLWVQGRKLHVQREHWTPEQILFRVPNDLGYGYFAIKVETRTGAAFARPIEVMAPPPVQLDLALVEQSARNWCWAAVSEMVLAFYGHDAAQCAQASALATQIDVELSASIDCCGETASEAQTQRCDATAPSLPFIQANLRENGGLDSKLTPGPVTFDALASEIDEGRPVILAYRGETRGHVVVVAGYDRAAGTAWVHDPSHGSFDVPFEELRHYFGDDDEMRWTDTIFEIE